MRVLWTSNMLFPEAAAALGLPEPVAGGWMTSLADDVVRSGVELGIASLYNGRSLRIFRTEKAAYYLIPTSLWARYYYKPALKPIWQRILKDFKPDLIHIHGSEYAFPLSLIEVAPQVPTAVSLQGLISVYIRYYMAEIPRGVAFRYHTLSDMVHLSGLFEVWLSYKLRSRMELRLLKSVSHVIGRTEWDYANSLAVNPALTYHRCGESLRDPFYACRWDKASIERHSILTSQATHPIKGLHLLLAALRLLKDRYPDLRLYVSGPKIVGGSGTRARTGYGKFIRRLIQDYGLEDVVYFTGPLNARAMAGRMAAVNVFVLPSAIENSPNSLGEAQLVGTPCVASYVGGVPDMAVDGADALLYDYRETAVLAQKIAQIFDDDALALRLSDAGKKSAAVRHSREMNISDLLEIYESILK